MSTTEPEYRERVAEWHFTVSLDVDNNVRTWWSVIGYADGDTYEGEVEGTLEDAVMVALATTDCPTDLIQMKGDE